MKTHVKTDLLKERLSSISIIEDKIDTESAKRICNELHSILIKVDEDIYWPKFPNTPHLPYNTMLYRVTKFYNGLDVYSPSAFSSPPKTITKIGRCNIPGNPVFYCSHSLKTCLEEVFHNDENSNNEIIYISEWKINVDKRWIFLGILFHQMNEQNPYFQISQQKKKEYLELFKSKGFDEEEFEKFNEFLHEQFLSVGDYRLSSIVSHSFLNDDNNDIVIYPSIQNNFIQCNLAFNNKVIDEKQIILNRVFSVEVIKNEIKPHFYKDIKTICKGIPNDGKLEWGNIFENEAKELYKLLEQ
jgi:hypothetical protein